MELLIVVVLVIASLAASLAFRDVEELHSISANTFVVARADHLHHSLLRLLVWPLYPYLRFGQQLTSGQIGV